MVPYEDVEPNGLILDPLVSVLLLYFKRNPSPSPAFGNAMGTATGNNIFPRIDPSRITPLTTMLTRILGGIYLSSIEPINQQLDLTQYNISHVLSVVPGPLPELYLENYQRLQVPITDESLSNIIPYLNKCYDFMIDALGPNKAHERSVLVHCAQGESRLVTVVAAFLMKRYGLSRDNAIHAVIRKCPEAMPNDGFLRQLDLFKEMGFEEDNEFPAYRSFVDGLASSDELRERFVAKLSSDHESRPLTFFLRCKRCRHTLASSHHVELHDTPDEDSKQSLFIKTAANLRRVISREAASVSCSHHFLAEPTAWMGPEMDKQEMDGKLNCPKCDAKVGAYSWKGSRCSCGKWMTPAIHLQTAKVDKVIAKDTK